jgi:hypothetical protein
MHMLSLGDDPLLGYLGGLGFRVRVFRGLGLEGEVWFGGFGDVGDACEFGGLHAAEALHAAHGVLGELAGQDGGAEAVLVAGHGAALEGVLEVLVLLAAAQLREAAALVAAPGGLDEGGGPGAPVVGVVPEGVLQLFAVEAPELAGDELEVVRGEREGLHLHDRLDGVGGDGQVTLRLGIQRPCQQLLPTKVPRFQHPVVEEPRPATVRRHALQRPKTKNQCRDEKLQKGTGQQTHISNKVETEMAFDVPAEIRWQALHEHLLVHSSRGDPLVLVVAANSLHYIMGQVPVPHPLLRISPLHSHLLQPQCQRLQICLINPPPTRSQSDTPFNPKP